jgi:LmbE family N-acetylglucosaminyl deacetylase
VITALHLAPHPDDEVLGAGATLLGLREHGHRVINLACSLGRAQERRERRRAEVVEACARAGFELIVLEPSRDDLAAVARGVIERERVDLVVAPDREEVHPVHAEVAAAALAAAEATGARLWTWGLWRDLARPTLFSGFGEERLARLQHALAAHRGELERNDFQELLRARAVASRVLGAERVFGFGAPRRPEPYAELLADDGPPRALDVADPLAR